MDPSQESFKEDETYQTWLRFTTFIEQHSHEPANAKKGEIKTARYRVNATAQLIPVDEIEFGVFGMPVDPTEPDLLFDDANTVGHSITFYHKGRERGMIQHFDRGFSELVDMEDDEPTEVELSQINNLIDLLMLIEIEGGLTFISDAT
jgi:hypothetical protein